MDESTPIYRRCQLICHIRNVIRRILKNCQISVFQFAEYYAILSAFIQKF